MRDEPLVKPSHKSAAVNDNVAATVAAVIPNWNQAELTRRCVAALHPQVDQIFVVDNHSEPEDIARLHTLARDGLTIISSGRNGGYAAGCNLGVEAAIRTGVDTVLVMNNDAFPDPGSVRVLRERLEMDRGLAAVGPAVVRCGTREVLHAACRLDLPWGRSRWPDRGATLDALDSTPVETDYLSGEAMLIRAAAVRDIAMFDERYFCYYEDVDWSLRARRSGWKLEVCPAAVFEHVLGGSDAGHVGVYLRARNLPLFLRVACGRRRAMALLLSAPAEMLAFASLLRRRRVDLAFRAVIGGWLSGVVMRR